MINKLSKVKFKKGVTLIELLVVIAILGIISATTLVSYSKFKSSMSLQNLVDDIALSIRKAQGYAIGVHNIRSDFDVGYGVDFRVGSSGFGGGSVNTVGTSKSFTIFANLDRDTNFDTDASNDCGTPSSENECLEKLTITSGDQISKLTYALVLRNGVLREYTIRNGIIDIFFNRPNPEPFLCYKTNPNQTGCNESNDTGLYYVIIQVSNPNNPGVYKKVTIWNNGQISVN